MNNEKTGALIRTLRLERGMTQSQLAQKLHVSDKAVSKWERGLGCPEVSLLSELSIYLGVNLDALLAGDLDAGEQTGGNMKKLKFYVCPTCGNLITALTNAEASCCGKRLAPLEAQKAGEADRLTVELIENEYCVRSAHEMSKGHSITFLALLTGDTLILKKLYPEWDFLVRIPRIGRGMLVWHCSRHGLFYQLV